MKQLKKIVVTHLPAFAVRWMSTAYHPIKSRHRAAKRANLRVLSAGGLIKDLKSAGIRQGDTIMVHSSLSSIGNIDGGAETLINSLIETVTESGTVLMPVFGSAEQVQDDYKKGKIVDLRTERSETGAVTERFRTWPDVYRSSHPFSSVCAWGKNAEYVISEHAGDPRICHPDSPMARLVELNGKVVGIGVSLGSMSIFHVIEDTWDKFPFRVNTNAFPIKYIDSTGNIVMRDVVKHDPIFSRTRMDQYGCEWLLEKFTYHFAKKGILQRFRFGNAESLVMETQPLYAELKRLAAKRITVYLTRDKWISMNRGDEGIDSW